ncbi:dsRBD fold-containing protein [Sinomonas mesophila]|uniref:dsRBD fold-containing protein n=1 Tax=Sinomonas mesophila TaxID=1531955 RepID=UPI0009868E46|nr:dsRBD fold-containing protein [Sinomonas mesophila]
MPEKSWSVNIVIDEYESQTRATATLSAEGRAGWEGVGLARLNPADRDIPAIGDELAAARALADLAHQLIETTAADIEKSTHNPAHLEA